METLPFFIKRLLSSLHSPAIRPSKSADEKPPDKLTVIDSRTSRSYSIPIHHNAVNALDFKAISTLGIGAHPLERFAKGLRIVDPGFQNTAVAESRITHMYMLHPASQGLRRWMLTLCSDGIRGSIQYRGRQLEDLFKSNSFEEVAYLLIWGHIPSAAEKTRFRNTLTENSKPSQGVLDAIYAFA